MLRPLRIGRLLDLATGHGKFAQVARDMGWEVTAIDARDARMPRSPGIDWRVGDVRDFDVSGYDVISNLGLLYHLDLPSQMDLLQRYSDTPMILDTHHATNVRASEGNYLGDWCEETTEAMASWGNPYSFWPTAQGLLRQVSDCGYGRVARIEPFYREDRTFYWCLPD